MNCTRGSFAFVAWSGMVTMCLLRAVVSPPQSQMASQGPAGLWARKTIIPTSRFEVGVTAAGGKIYVLGGEAFGKPASGLNQQYNPSTNRWRDLAPIPHETSHVGVAALDGQIYAMGGNTAVPEVGPLDLAFEYDIAKDVWRKLPSLSSPRGSIGVVALEGKIHVIGGRGIDRVTVATHEVYDPHTNMWSKAAPRRAVAMGMVSSGRGAESSHRHAERYRQPAETRVWGATMYQKHSER